ncbi:hypothetical protein COU56_01700 [Candidatus Pacearchaeota archaeon CG10_big_fil_rev_8_21_14_0_10_31_9]|nr:MAG: hypothetical protein COU56_01700 [Candidatus Pacearchaeota archaeon CG10_big_fil_rev_8_21_14_0_10_31_9]PIZ82721.1 MAG: hypothetical protein COX97_03365 [Candidatus Pacearchaeota archaeon CG_4_10_14_0_2_um_filter_05_32_18]
MKSLIFVYNADSGIFNSISDSIHKIISPSTYQCNLCKITYGITNEKDEWKNYISSLPYRVIFLHKEEFKKQYPNVKERLPAVFKILGSKTILLISADEINKCKNLSDLKKLVDSRLTQPKILNTKNK